MENLITYGMSLVLVVAILYYIYDKLKQTDQDYSKLDQWEKDFYAELDDDDK